MKTASKIPIELVTSDLISNKTADKITKVSNTANKIEAENTELNKQIPKERYISPEKRQKIIDELRLI